jgi:outer membrane receptor protein involved in Fe transport
VRSGNSNLEPEDSTNYSAGIVVQPPFLKDLVVTADYWRIDQRGVIGIQGAQNQILYDLLLRRRGSSNPNVVRLAPLAGQTVGQLDFVQDDYFNLQPRSIRGLDLELSYRLRNTPLGSFNIQLAGARLLDFDQEPSEVQAELIAANAAGLLGPGIAIAGANSLLRQNGNPLWRASGNLTWRAGPVRAGVLVNYVSSVEDTGPAPVDGKLFQLPSWTTVNAYAEYAVPEGGNFGGTRFRVGARNIFDKDPPVYSNNFGFLGSLHNAIGRFIYFELSKNF